MMYASLGFTGSFIIGGFSGVIVAEVPLDMQLHDTYFIVAHIHYVLFGGSVMTIMAGLHYWFPKVTGRMFNTTLGHISFWFYFIGTQVTFSRCIWWVWPACRDAINRTCRSSNSGTTCRPSGPTSLAWVR
jgi:heme/copper-type cytochrome/quinol oxidase subunit 1